jgi:hypothetical protein
LKNQLGHIFQPIKNDISDGNEQLRTTNWTSTIVISIITLAVGSFITICVQWAVRSLLNDGLTGVKLKEHCTEIIVNRLKLNKNDVQVNMNFVFKDNSLYFSDSIVFCGSYKRGEDFDINNENYGGRFIAIFERNKEKFFNRILNTEPNYAISYFLECHGSKWDTEFWFFHDPKLEILDVDGNGNSKFSLTFVTNFADRLSKSVLFFDRDTNGKWMLINPDLSNLEDEVRKEIPDLYILYIDSFSFFENGKEIQIYSLALHGEYFWADSPYSQQSALYLKFGIWLDEESNLQEHGCGIVAYIYENGKTKRSSIWNDGNICYFKDFPGIKNDNDLLEFKEFLQMLWGHQGVYGFFYGMDY